MGLDADLRTELIAASTTLAQRVHQNYVPQQQATLYPRAWYGRAATEEHLDLDGTRGAACVYQYDVECISSSLSEATAAADAVRTSLNGKRGTFGAGAVRGCFVEDQSDDYVPRGTGEDAGLHVTALRITIHST